MMNDHKGLYGILIAVLISSNPSALATETVEEKLVGSLSSLINHQFVYNPALLANKSSQVSVLALKDSRDSKVVANPNNNRQEISYSNESDILGVGLISAFVGGALALSYNEVKSVLTTNNSLANGERVESQDDRSLALRFMIELTPTINFGFHYQYKQSNRKLWGNHFLGDDDQSSYEGFLAGYRLGVYYQNPRVGLALYTAPALRGKAEIDSEQKILTEPGTAGLDLTVVINSRITAGLTATNWYYKKDDRLETSTSPVDQRSISLGGLELDQYLAKIRNIGLGMSYQGSRLRSVSSISQQESAFHFDEDSLPGDNRDDIPSFRYYQIQSTVEMLTPKYDFGVGIKLSLERTQDAIRDQGNHLGSRDYQSYKATEELFYLNVNFKF